MIPETNVVEVTADNISRHPQAICFINPKHEYYSKKEFFIELDLSKRQRFILKRFEALFSFLCRRGLI